ncbi:sugar transferase [Primorskyibacter sp. S187A]|uniref:sugar transferase n=1 Tax=Primorskyibacter sp. S187A TaxID=3415130 RepID=UPI003C7D80BA
MRDINRKFISFLLFQLWEIGVFCLAVTVGMIALENAGFGPAAAYADAAGLSILAVLALLWNRLLNAFDLYLSRRLVARSNEYFSLVFAVVIAAGFLALLGALLNQPLNQLPFLAWFMVTAVTFLLPGRLVSRLFLRAARAYGRNVRFVAIVGTGREGQSLARHILKTPQNGYRILGMFDVAAPIAPLQEPFRYEGDLNALTQRLMREPVDEVLIALPLEHNYPDVMRVLEICARTGVSARVTGDLLKPAGFAAPDIEQLGARAFLHYNARPDWGWQGYAKRGFDILGAGLGLVALLPILLMVIVAIKLDSRGPAFFVQNRVGRDRKTFKFLKFRTMVQNAEALQKDLESQNEAGGPVFKIKKDPRITRLGAFLRKYSIDELPQLINVLKGDMSLVGPRPLPLRDVERFEHDWHARRFSVRPGLTCAWVLKGRSQLAFDDWVQTDLEYIDNWSLMQDVNICLRTIPAVFRGSGAY